MTSTPSFTFFSRCRLSPGEPGSKLSVVWLEGDHNIATKDELAATIARAIALGEPAVVVDLSNVHFLSAATLHVFVTAEETLQAQSRTLVLRAPSPFVRRVFEVTGLSDLLDREAPEGAIDTGMEGGALESWVEVVTTGRIGSHDTVIEEPTVGEQVSVDSAPAERPLFARIP